MKCTIQIDFSSDALKAIAGQRVTLERPVLQFVNSQQSRFMQEDQAPPRTPVAWLAFSPMEANFIEWDDRCDLYAAATLPPLRSTITPNAYTKTAQPGDQWGLQDGAFSRESNSALPDYRVINRQGNGFCLGLIAAATVNGLTRPLAALNIQPALLNERVVFSSPQTVTIFLSTAPADGSIIPDGISGLEVPITAGSLLKVGFNDASHSFYVAS